MIPLREAARAWFAISLQTFGGPAGQIAVMQRTLVDEKRWIGQQRFLFALSYCTLLPGPEAQQLATYVGWLLNGVKGALDRRDPLHPPRRRRAPRALRHLRRLRRHDAGRGALPRARPGRPRDRRPGPHPALAARASTTPPWSALAVASFVALTFFAVPFPVVVGLAALVGWALGRAIPSLAHRRAAAADDGPAPLISDDALHTERPSTGRSARILVIGLVAVVRAGGAGRPRLRPVEHLRRPGPVLLRRRGRHLRRRLRRAGVRRPAGRQRLRLARSPARWSAASRSPRRPPAR